VPKVSIRGEKQTYILMGGGIFHVLIAPRARG
jgi:hypothetical protein